MNFTCIKETCLYSSNLSETRRFYEGKLGFEVINELKDKHVFFRVGHSVLLFFDPEDSSKKKDPPGHYATGKQHIAFEVAAGSYKNIKQKIIEAGIPILHEQSWKKNLQSFYFEDPNGHVLEVVPLGLWN